MGDWEQVFKEQGKFFYKPHTDMKKIARMLKKKHLNKVLDLGCGSGRHTIFLAKQGFDTYGSDISKTGLKITRAWLKEKKLKAKLKHASCYKKFPYKDNFFDSIVSVQVIHHAKIRDIKFCISEIFRILKPGGITFITVAKDKRNKYRSKSKMIAPRTFVPLDGHEVGTPHYQYNQALMRKDFKKFKIIDVYIDDHDHYCILAKKTQQ